MTKQIKISKIAIGTHELSVTLLDSNGRLWTATQDVGHGGVVSGWYNDPDAGAVALSIDSSGTTWVVNSSGQIFSRKAISSDPFASLPDWTEDSLKDAKGNFVEATQISTGDHYYQAIDDKKRLWGRTLPHPGAGTGIPDSGWLIDRSASDVRSTAAGYRSEDTYCINESGQLYRWLNGKWTLQEIVEGSSKDLSKVESLKAGSVELTESWQSILFYRTKDGHIHQPSKKRADRGSVYFEDSVGIGVDFAVIDVNDIWMVNDQGDIYRRTKERTPDALVAEGEPIPVTVQGDQYFWRKYKGPDFREARIYWVQPGDTFNQIAADFGISPGVLKDRNKQVVNVDRINAGERLTLV